ncbi:MAG: DUF2911 domain-containing protein [Fulvivirga sp.]|nr:DUF2911 domain-containing protein [Fulvivirga sp.]
MKSLNPIPFIIFLLFITANLFAQLPVAPRPSPLAIAKMKHKDVYVKVTYSQPHKQGRKIFGHLVPYGKIWRTGANEATEITLTDTLIVAGDTLNAGTYSVFSIPQKEQWTIIFNNELGQWGAYNYLQESDELRVEVPVEKIEDVVWEPFTITFDKKNGSADMVLMWDQTRVRVPINFIH